MILMSGMLLGTEAILKSSEYVLVDKMFYQLKYEIFEENNGTWCTVTRSNFDLFMIGDPYLSLTMLINLDTSKYIVRVLDLSM